MSEINPVPIPPRAPNGRLLPGMSLNPGGRRKGIGRMLDRLFGEDVETAYEWLAQRFRDKRTKPEKKDEIAFFLIERRHGRPMQMQVNVDVAAEVKELTNDELAQRIAELAGENPQLADAIGQRGIAFTPGRTIEADGKVIPRNEPGEVHPGGLANR